ncbi:MAG: DUF1028 domain-containing protein [Candidatus Eisenbacteria bacterium]|uniref:DUF1028 domain-containing protein n=1 Tax=Eiseniibacteriota bacterium TaxID=2212470 RepID=A0A538T5P2_UNCEI|nr:MAG: DUF1028 domain-containing protein [Candidatus Eisenbacteria bacterium]
MLGERRLCPGPLIARAGCFLVSVAVAFPAAAAGPFAVAGPLSAAGPVPAGSSPGYAGERSSVSAPAAFAILALDSLRQEWGAAVVSRWISVGARSLSARAGAGVWVGLELPDPRRAALALERMAGGLTARAALDSLLAGDARRGERQAALLDRSGGAAAFTGDLCPAWAGERTGRGYVCQGVGLRDGGALMTMGRAFETAGGTLGERLLAAVEAAESIAPLREDGESAAVLIVREGGGPNGWSDRMVDLRVDDAPDAVQELKRIYAAHAATFLPAAYARFGDEAKRRGDSISAEREYSRAEAGFRAAVARSPKNPDALNELAWFLATHDRGLEDALRFAKAAVLVRPDDPNLYDTLAETEYRSGSLNRAIEAMTRAVKRSGGAMRYTDRLRRWERERSALEGKSPPDSGGGRAR